MMTLVFQVLLGGVKIVGAVCLGAIVWCVAHPMTWGYEKWADAVAEAEREP